MVPLPELSAAYGRVTDRLSLGLVGSVEALWLGLPNYRDADVARFTRAAVPLISSAHGRMASLTAAYQFEAARSLGLASERVLLDRAKILSPRGVATDVLLQRPAVTLYSTLAQGGSMTEAVTASVRRLKSIVSTDVQLVRTLQAQASLGSSEVAYYRRVLGGGESCELCEIASSNRYSRDDLMPIHDNCRCYVEPVLASWRPPVVDGGDLDGDRLEVEDGDEDLDSLVAVRQHGEVGPVLVPKGQKFTGPDDL